MTHLTFLTGPILMATVVVVVSGCQSERDGSVIHKERISIAGHRGRIRSLCFSPDGKTLASGSEDGSAKIWDTSNWQLLRTIGDNSEKPPHVMAVRYSPDGKSLAIGRQGGAFELHKDATNELARLGGSDENVWSIAFTPDGKLIATVKREILTIWNSESGAVVKSFPVSDNQLWCVACSPDGQMVASGGFEGNVVRLSSIDKGIVGESLAVSKGCVSSLVYFRDGKTLAVGGDFIWLLDPSNGNQKAMLWGHGLGSRSIALNADESRLVSAGYGGDLLVWDLKTSKVIATYWGNSREELWSVALSPDGKTIVSGNEKGTLTVWDMVK